MTDRQPHRRPQGPARAAALARWRPRRDMWRWRVMNPKGYRGAAPENAAARSLSPPAHVAAGATTGRGALVRADTK